MIKNTKKKGITLVALIITIIILLILAMVSISLVINGGIISKSEETVFKTEIEQYNEELKIAIAEDTANNLGFRDKFNVRRNTYSSEGSFTNAMKTKIPSFKEKYANKLEIKEDTLTYIGEDEQERQWLAQTISLAGILKISYVYENGNEVASTYQKVITDGNYEVESPSIEGYEPDHYIVAGEIDGDTNITVTYYSSSQGLAYIGLDSSDNETDIEENIVAYTLSGIGTFTGENLVIPRTYNGKPVTQVKNKAFSSNKTIKTLVIPDSIETVKTTAFETCTNLEYININSKKLEYFVFRNSKVKKADIGKNLDEILSYPFENCNMLNEVKIYTENADIIGPYFKGCSDLKGFMVNKDNNKYKEMDGVLYSKDGKKIYAYPYGKEGDFIIPESVEEIVDSSFSNNQLTKIEIPSTVKRVGNYAFAQCNNIASAYINAEIINMRAFNNNSNLKEIKIGINVKKIYYYVFDGCQCIEEVTYEGTKEQFNSIIVNGWNTNTNITQVICSDGILDV